MAALVAEQSPDFPVVVALGSVDPALVSGVLDGQCRFVAAPGDAELAVAAGAIARADARVDRALLGRAPGLRVIARTGSAPTWLTCRPRRPGESPW